MDPYSFKIDVNGKKYDMLAVHQDRNMYLHLDRLLAACGAPDYIAQKARDEYKYLMTVPKGETIESNKDAHKIYVNPDQLMRMLPSCLPDGATPGNCVDLVSAMKRLADIIDAISQHIVGEDDDEDSGDEILFHDIAVRTKTGVSMVHAGLVNEKDYVVECLSLLRAAGMTPKRWECLKDRLPFQKLGRITIDVEDGDFAIPLFYGAPDDYIGFVNEILDVADHCRDDACSKDMNALARNMEFLLENLPAAFKSADEYIGCWYEFPDFIDEEYGLDDEDDGDEN